MNLDHAFGYVVGGVCAYILGFYALAELAAWNRRRAARAAANRARRDARMAHLIERTDFAMWRMELEDSLPVIDVEGEW